MPEETHEPENKVLPETHEQFAERRAREESVLVGEHVRVVTEEVGALPDEIRTQDAFWQAHRAFHRAAVRMFHRYREEAAAARVAPAPVVEAEAEAEEQVHHDQ
jgi:hypothetical protein